MQPDRRFDDGTLAAQATEDGDPMDTEAVDSDMDQEEEGENAQQVEMAAARNLRGILDPHDHPSSHTYGGCRPLTSRYGPAAALMDLAHKAEQDSGAGVKTEGSTENAGDKPEQAPVETDQEPVQVDPSRIMYGNEAFFIFFRLHHYLYDRCASSPLHNDQADAVRNLPWLAEGQRAEKTLKADLK